MDSSAQLPFQPGILQESTGSTAVEKQALRTAMLNFFSRLRLDSCCLVESTAPERECGKVDSNVVEIKRDL